MNATPQLGQGGRRRGGALRTAQKVADALAGVFPFYEGRLGANAALRAEVQPGRTQQADGFRTSALLLARVTTRTDT